MCTIILVVSFLTMLKAVVDVAPIAFLKVGQDQGGAFDLTLTSDYSQRLVDGDESPYSSDPFKYKVKKKPTNLFEQLSSGIF